MNQEALNEAIKLGGVSFFPKELMSELEELLEDVVLGGGKMLWWRKSLEKTGHYFAEKFGPTWKDKNKFFREFEESLKNTQQK